MLFVRGRARLASLFLLVLVALAATRHGPRAGAAMPPDEGQPGGYSPSFELTGAVLRPRTYTLADLQRLPAPHPLMRESHRGHRGQQEAQREGYNVHCLMRPAAVRGTL